MFSVFVNEISCTSIKSAFEIMTVAVELKTYSEIFNSTATVIILNAHFIDVQEILLTKTKKLCILYSLL
jgi:hypothetical protein